MADIELVIKIPEEKYDVIKSDLYNTFPAEMKERGLEAIKNGKPLPKGHGRLKDEIRAEITNIPITDTDGHNNNWYREPQAIINDVLRIIDKYKAESEG